MNLVQIRALLAELDRCHPAVHLVVVEGTSTSLEERLSCGRVDLAVVDIAERDPALRVDRLFDEELLLVVPPITHLRAVTKSISPTSAESS